MPSFPDQTGRSVSITFPTRRIISLVPSITETLHYFEAGDSVVGITKFCVHPDEWFRSKTRVGGTKNISMETVRKLRPDLIFANKEENVKEQIEELSKRYPVWISDVKTLEDACNMIMYMGLILGREMFAEAITRGIDHDFQMLPRLSPAPRTAYLIWKDPYMTVGHDTFIHDMMTRCGFENVFAAQTRYPEITIEQLQAANCQLLLLSSEPYPFSQKHADELQAHLPNTKILLVDGEMFSWYGSRLLKAGDYFKQLQTDVVNGQW
jgi:ABC-type Fe3+-hydroxamate transport system substrate-binding protein